MERSIFSQAFAQLRGSTSLPKVGAQNAFGLPNVAVEDVLCRNAGLVSVIFVSIAKDSEGGSDNVNAGVEVRNGIKRMHDGRMLIMGCGGTEKVAKSVTIVNRL